MHLDGMQHRPWLRQQDHSSSVLFKRRKENRRREEKLIPALSLGGEYAKESPPRSSRIQDPNLLHRTHSEPELNHQQPACPRSLGDDNLEGDLPVRPILGSKAYSVPRAPYTQLFLPQVDVSVREDALGYRGTLRSDRASRSSSGSVYSQDSLEEDLVYSDPLRPATSSKPGIEIRRGHVPHTSGWNHSEYEEDTETLKEITRESRSEPRNPSSLEQTNTIRNTGTTSSAHCKVRTSCINGPITFDNPDWLFSEP